MFRPTGPGKFEIRVQAPDAGVLTSLLYNFDFDDSADKQDRPLKDEHIKFLDDRIVPLLRGNRGNIWMQGSASRIGTNAWNMELSQSRVARVKNFLITRGVRIEQMQLNAVGEELAAWHSEDDPRDRSVFLWVMPQMKKISKTSVPPVVVPPVPPLPVKVPPIPEVTIHFSIAMAEGLSVTAALDLGKVASKVRVSGGVAVDVINFLIWDRRSNIASLYHYVGGGIGTGLAFMPRMGGTLHGPWTRFETEKPIACWDFSGRARFTSASAAKWSANWISLTTPAGVNDVDSLPISTGFTVGAGMSTTAGRMYTVGRPYKFSGP